MFYPFCSPTDTLRLIFFAISVKNLIMNELEKIIPIEFSIINFKLKKDEIKYNKNHNHSAI
jgi:hypothetical protein